VLEVGSLTANFPRETVPVKEFLIGNYLLKIESCSDSRLWCNVGMLPSSALLFCKYTLGTVRTSTSLVSLS